MLKTITWIRSLSLRANRNWNDLFSPWNYVFIQATNDLTYDSLLVVSMSLPLGLALP